MSPRRIVLGSSAGVRNGVLPSRGSRRRAASAVGSGLGGGVVFHARGFTAVLLCAALFENCVRGVDAGCHQGGISPVRDACVERCHVTLKCVSGPGLGRRADEYDLSVWWCRSLTRRGRGRANDGGWSPYSFGSCGRIRHTMSLCAPRSKQYQSPAGSASAGVGSPSKRHRSMKCFREAERSLQLQYPPLGDEPARRHRAHRKDGDVGRLRRPLARLDDAAPFIETDTPFPCCSGHHAAVSCDAQVRRWPPARGPPLTRTGVTTIEWRHR